MHALGLANGTPQHGCESVSLSNNDFAGEGMSLQQMAPYCPAAVPKTHAEFINHCETQNDFSEKCCR